jgi:uncharacterized protein (TIGR03790 family)
VQNPYFDPSATAPFSRADHDIYLVTRLDGYTWEDIRRLVDRATAPSRHGKIVLDMKGSIPASGAPLGDGWLRAAAWRLNDSGLEVVVDSSARVVTGETDVIGYAGWGSNDPANTTRSPGFRWLPGAIASWFVSTSARTFTAPPAGWRVGSGYAGSSQSLVGDRIAEGVTGTVGYVYEPYLEATARPQIFLPAYRAGFTLAESFQMSLPNLSWQAVVIGDPLVAVPRQEPGPRGAMTENRCYVHPGRRIGREVQLAAQHPTQVVDAQEAAGQHHRARARAASADGRSRPVANRPATGCR